MIPAQCRKVKEDGDLITGKLTTEAPVNNDHNYNGPKVAKILVWVSFDPHERHDDLGTVSERDSLK
jgi:hypothetical protein